MIYKHGMTRSPEWNIWTDMRKRCTKWSHPHFARYGGRGITVCKRWQVFTNFLADMGPRPSPKHTLERIDNDKSYEPGNVRWATRKEQANNRSSNKVLTAFGKTQTLQQWADETGIKTSTIRMRLSSCQWSVEKALTHPVAS